MINVLTLSRPPTFNLDLQSHAENRADLYGDRQHGYVLQCRRHSHSLDNVARYQELQAEHDRVDEVLPEAPNVHRLRGRNAGDQRRLKRHGNDHDTASVEPQSDPLHDCAKDIHGGGRAP